MSNYFLESHIKKKLFTAV